MVEMITQLKEAEAEGLSLADVDRYLEATGKVNVLYRSRSILEIGQCTNSAREAEGLAGYRVVFKDYEPLGCGDVWSPLGAQFFDFSRKREAIACFLYRLRNNPEERWDPSADGKPP